MSKELIEKLAKAMVHNPDQVRVSETKTNRITVVELTVAREDVGQVVGRKGQNARAMRALLQAVSSKAGYRATLEILNE